MEIISLSNSTQNGVQNLSLVLEDDNGDIRTINVPKSSSRHDRTLKLATQIMASDDLEERERAFDAIAAMHDVSRRIATELQKLDSDTRGSFAVARAGVLYEGQLLPSTISSHILRIINDDSGASSFDRWSSFAKFVEKLYSNVNEHVREQLFDWLVSIGRVSGGFTLTKDGNIIGYKGVGRNADGVPVSLHAGHAFVISYDDSGEEVVKEYKHDQIPNAVGTQVMMPRTEVQNDPSVGCSYGLHVSNIEYARSYASAYMLLVEVDPRDFVSVPTECDAQKARVSRYKVLSIVDEQVTSTYYSTDEDEYDEDEDDYADDYDDGYGWA